MDMGTLEGADAGPMTIRRRTLAVGLAVLAAAVVLAVAMSPRGAPSAFLAVADGLPVVTVADANALAYGTADPALPIAVAGWYSQAPVHSCPAPIGPDGRMRSTSRLELYCVQGDWGLTARDEPVVDVTITSSSEFTSIAVRHRTVTGSVLQPVFGLSGIPLDAYPRSGADESPATWEPIPVVLVGHVHDPGAAACEPDTRQACLQRFVVDHVAWVHGHTLGTAVQVNAPGGRTPRLSEADVERVARAAIGDGALLLVVASGAPSDLAVVDASVPQDRLGSASLIWYVRALGRRGGVAAGAARLGTLVIDDGTGEVAWSAFD